MSKYVFKNPEVEKALRLVIKEFGFQDDQLDTMLEMWNGRTTVSLTYKGQTLLSFSTVLLKEVKPFNPDGWNDSDVIPPEDEDDLGTSKIMLIENDDGYPQKGYYNFETKSWRELGTIEEIECSRYRPYPFN